MKQKLFFLLTALMCVLGTSAWALEKDADGIYQIGTAEDLVAFSELVNGGEGTASARLTADIDMTGYNEFFQPIGTEGSLYSGTFDGQGHRIKNLNISIARDCVGVFGMIQSPAVIKNFVLDESCTIEGLGHYCAIIGQARGANGPIYMENLGMEGTIHLTGWNGAGIIGNNNNDAAKFNMKNCYVTGTVTPDGGYSGALTGWAGGNGVFENCWVIGQVSGTDSDDAYFIRGTWSSSITNCYSKVGTQAINITDEQITSGELCSLLNAGNDIFRQNIGEDSHPVLDKTHGIVKQITDAGYATMYNPQTAVTIPSGVEAFTGTVVNDQLWLRPLQEVVIQGQAVVLKGNAGFYSFKPVDVGDGLIQSDILGTDEPLETNGTQYVLAQKDGTIGFYKAEGTIPAGKAYLIGAAGVKGYFFNTTGIEAVEGAETLARDGIYDLSGRRVEKATKGIYIINGKKVIK